MRPDLFKCLARCLFELIRYRIVVIHKRVDLKSPPGFIGFTGWPLFNFNDYIEIIINKEEY